MAGSIMTAVREDEPEPEPAREAGKGREATGEKDASASAPQTFDAWLDRIHGLVAQKLSDTVR